MKKPPVIVEQHFCIHFYSVESDYIYQELKNLKFDTLKEAKKWVSINIPKHLGAKITKVRTSEVWTRHSSKPHYIK